MARPRKADRLREIESDITFECDVPIVHLDAVQHARSTMPDHHEIAGMSAVFGALGDPTRMRILAALSTQELCVCDLGALLGMSQSAVSHQLRQLRNLGLVKGRRAGRLNYYSLDDDHVLTLVEQAREHVRHQAYEKDATA